VEYRSGIAAGETPALPGTAGHRPDGWTERFSGGVDGAPAGIGGASAPPLAGALVGASGGARSGVSIRDCCRRDARAPGNLGPSLSRLEVAAGRRTASQYAAVPNDRRVVLIMDLAGWRVSLGSEIPEGVHLQFPPAHSSELQGVEGMRKWTEELPANGAFEPLEETGELLVKRCGAGCRRQRTAHERSCGRFGGRARIPTRPLVRYARFRAMLADRDGRDGCGCTVGAGADGAVQCGFAVELGEPGCRLVAEGPSDLWRGG